MREPFAYESNVGLIRNLVVPDPLSPAAWEKQLREWNLSGGEESLLEWLILEGTLTEEELLGILAGWLGVPYLLRHEYRLLAAASPEEQLLEAHGFRTGLTRDGKRFLAGGTGLPPETESLLPSGGEHPQWVLLSPLRGQRKAGGRRSGVGELESASLAGWLRETINSQLTTGASDIHFERIGPVLTIRVHGKGIMETVGQWKGGRGEPALMILKRWANISTAGSSLPQDGRIRLFCGGRERVLRLSHLNTVDGESLVLRLPEPSGAGLGLDQLGMPVALRDELRHAIQAASGMILICGSTGSGKTTTAYALLDEIRNDPVKVLTIEDPVERELGFAVQSSVNLNSDWTFSSALRSFLRQDPDVIFLGEMRDGESAVVACRAALTGHAVVATLHAGGISTALQRMAGWGLPKGTLEETLDLVVHQAWPDGARAGHPDFRWKRF